MIRTFQGLRGATILMIAISHWISALSFLGVGPGNTIFFVLAGFLAMYTWQPSEGSILADMASRYIRKIHKFYITFLVAEVLAIPLSLHILRDAMAVPKIIVNLLLLQTWIPDYSGYGWMTLAMPAWFLCTYLFCECMVPILAPLADRLRERHITIAGFVVPILIPQFPASYSLVNSR